MADDIEVPDWVHTIPDDADEGTKLYMRAQIVIQAAFHAFGHREAKPGMATLSTDQLTETLSFALGMLLASDEGLKTKRDIRMEAEGIAKHIAASAQIFRDTGDATPQRLLDALGMTISKIN